MTTTGYTVAIKRNTVYLYVNLKIYYVIYLLLLIMLLFIMLIKIFKLKFKTYYLK